MCVCVCLCVSVSKEREQEREKGKPQKKLKINTDDSKNNGDRSIQKTISNTSQPRLQLGKNDSLAFQCSLHRQTNNFVDSMLRIDTYRRTRNNDDDDDFDDSDNRSVG